MTECGDQRVALRTEVLRAHGATQAETKELLSWSRRSFALPSQSNLVLPLPDEDFVGEWRRYATECRRAESLTCLAQHLFELRFPVETGIRHQHAYLAAARGHAAWNGECASLVCAHLGDIFIHPTLAGHVPVVLAGCREDFVSMVCALARQNEPTPVSHTIGAMLIDGYRNRARSPETGGVSTSNKAMLRRDRDRFILLSRGPYSNIPLRHLGLEESEWTGLSIRIRLEHECAHYLVRRALGPVVNRVMEEILADYAGICAACGSFRSDWALLFLGYHQGQWLEEGRLHQYHDKRLLSPGAFRTVQRLIVNALINLETVDAADLGMARGPARRAAVILALSEMTLEELASDGGRCALRGAVQNICSRVRISHDPCAMLALGFGVRESARSASDKMPGPAALAQAVQQNAYTGGSYEKGALYPWCSR